MLKELEGMVLGLVFKKGPCTAYTVRQILRHSPSSHWRGSAGSIYPLLERLEGLGLLEAQDDPHDGRARRLLAITSEGRKALKAWIKAGTCTDVIAQVSDPVRSRVYFLDALSPKERAKLTREMLKALQDFLAQTAADLDDETLELSELAKLGVLGAVMVNEARVEFLKEVVNTIAD